MESIKGMKKSKRTGVIFLIVAVVLAALAGLMSLSLTNSAHKEVGVLIAKENIEEGDPLSKDLFEQKKVHPSGTPETAVAIDDLDLSGTVSTSSILKGDILRDEHMMTISDLTQELPLISTRVKAIGNDNLVGAEIPITSISGLLDGLKKGDKVTVVSVTEDPATRNITSKTILTNIEVVSVKTGDEGGGSDDGVVAVALTQGEFEKLSLARDIGTVHIAVQPLGVTIGGSNTNSTASGDNVNNIVDENSENNATGGGVE